jgi:hypothetical protein
MSYLVTLYNNTTIPCQRDGCTNICSKHNYFNFYRGFSKLSRQYLANTLCDTCNQLCCYTDTNGNLCYKSTLKPGLCVKHKMLLDQLSQYKSYKAAVEFHKNNVYIGFHWEKADDDGPIDIYHYLSRDKYNKIIESNPNFDFKNFLKYDEEIWIGDELWSYCGPYAESRLEQMNYPDNFEEQIQTQLLVIQ